VSTTNRASPPDAAGQTSDRSRRRGAVALAWWRRLTDSEHGDAAALARLRRSRTALEALGVNAAASLARQLGATNAGAPDGRTKDVLQLARVLAHVKEHDASQHPMRAAGWKRFAGDRRETDAGEDRPLLSEARFRRLLETGEGDEKVAAFTRLIAIMGGVVNVDALSDDYLHWNYPEIGDRVREQWAFQYYAAGAAAPAALITDTENNAE
jgi:CRISPR system Cascade subunit CasB